MGPTCITGPPELKLIEELSLMPIHRKYFHVKYHRKTMQNIFIQVFRVSERDVVVTDTGQISYYSHL